MSNRDKIMWNADPLTDELSRQPRLDDSDDDIVGTDWGKVGKTALGVNHMVGKTLLKAIGMGGVADSMERLQAKGGALPDWATKTMKVSGPSYVVIARGGKDPLVVNNASKVIVFGGKRFDGEGWQPGMPTTTYSVGVESPARVEISYKSADIMKAAKSTNMTDVTMVVFLGGDAIGNLDSADAPAAAAQPAAAGGMGGMMGGMGGMMGGTKVSGMDDEEDLETEVGTYSAYDIAANIFTGGLYAAGKKYSEKDYGNAMNFVEPKRDAAADERITAGKSKTSAAKARLADVQKQRDALRAARGRGTVTSTPVDTGDFARRLEVARQQIAASTGEAPADDGSQQASDGAQAPDAQAVLGELSDLGIINSEDGGAEDALGMSFEWQYVFDPYAAVQDKEFEDKYGTSTAMNFVEPVRDAEVDAKITDNKQRTEDALQRLADTKKKIADLKAARLRRLVAKSRPENVLGELSRMGIINSKGSNAMAHDDNELETGHDEELEAIMGDLGYVNIVGDDDADDEIVGARYRTDIIGGRKRKAIKKSTWGGPGCADASKEGGACDLMGSLDGDGSSYLMGSDILGADPKPPKRTPRAGFVKRQTADGNTVLSLSATAAKKGDHKSTYLNAHDVGTRAVSLGTKLLKAVQKGGTKVKGYEDEVFGAAPKRSAFVKAAPAPAGKPGRKRLTPFQIKQIAKSTKKAGEDLLAYNKKYGKQVDAHTAKLDVAAQATAKKMNKVSTKVVATRATAQPAAKSAAAKTVATKSAATSRVKGDDVFGYGDADILGQTNIFGAEILGDLGPRDLYDDLDIMGEIDILGLEQTAELLGAHFDIISGDLAAMVLGDGEEPAPDAAPADAGGSAVDPLADAVSVIGPPPTKAPPRQPNIDYMPDPYAGHPWDDPMEYRGAELPLGALVFDGSLDLSGGNEARVGSQNKFLANGPPSKRWGQDSGYQHGGDGWQTYDASNYKGLQWSHPDEGEMNDLSANSMQLGWGPLIGHHKTEMAGARWHVPTKQWFWYYDTVGTPEFKVIMVDRLKAPDELLRLNQAITEYQTALTAFKTDQAAQAAADQLEKDQAAALAKQQAAEDAATARRQEQEQKESAHKADLQTKADEQAQTTQSAIQAAQAAAYAAKTGTETEAYKGQAQADSEAYKGQAQADSESRSSYEERRSAIEEKQLQAEEERTLRMAEKEAEFMAANPEQGGEQEQGGGEQGGGEQEYPDETSRELHEEAGSPEQYQDEADARAMDQDQGQE